MASQSADDPRIWFSQARSENDHSPPALNKQAGVPIEDHNVFSLFTINHPDRAQRTGIFSTERGPVLDSESEVPASTLKSHSPPPREMLTRSSRFLYTKARSSSFVWDFIPFLLAYLLLLATTRLHQQAFPREEDHEQFARMPVYRVDRMNTGSAQSIGSQTRLPSYFEATQQAEQERLRPHRLAGSEPERTTGITNGSQLGLIAERPPSYEAPSFGLLPAYV